MLRCRRWTRGRSPLNMRCYAERERRRHRVGTPFVARSKILQKLGLHDRVELVRYAIRNGLAEA